MPKSKAKTVAASAIRKPRAAKLQPTRGEIALRAYHIYLERGRTPGNEQEDWIRAEQELLGLSKKPRSKSKVVSIAA